MAGPVGLPGPFLRFIGVAEVLDPGAVDPIPEYERIAAVHEGLAQLGSPCRELLTALYIDPSEPSYAQIADRLGRAVGSLGSMRARCLLKLRSIMGEDVIP